tara:strand:+ start:685 stop:915 length:231 start_codon:yes stop_codon:yes gene_type:complete
MGVIKQIEEAREFLKSKGYYVDNLWTIDDVQQTYECTDEEAYIILDRTLQNEWIIGNIFEMIDGWAETYELKHKEE